MNLFFKLALVIKFVYFLKPFSYEKDTQILQNKQTNKQLLIKHVFIFLLPIIFPSHLYSQNFPEKVSKEGLVLDGKIVDRTTSWSADKKTIYTINWFEINDLYYGQPSSNRTNMVPVLTEGGATDEGLLVVTHTINFHQGYNYLLALEPCSDCIEGTTVYIPWGGIGKFNKLSYIQEKTKWASKNRITSELKNKDCDEEENTLLISFSNVHVQVGLDGIQGYVDLKTKTTDNSKVLYDLSSKINYTTSLFGQNIVTNQNLEINPIGIGMEEAYSTETVDIFSDKAGFSMTKNLASPEGMLINTTFQSTMRLNFRVDPANISQLPSDLNGLYYD